MSRLGLGLEILRAEGPRGLLERAADRLRAARDRAEEVRVTPGRLSRELEAGGGAPVLDVLATPPDARFGGVPVQLEARRPDERRLRPTALLAPEGGWWSLSAASGGRRWRARLVRRDVPESPIGASRRGVAAILEAVRLVGARIVNVEGASGWPPHALLPLAAGPAKLVLSLHDFALYCPRPNLVEEPYARFCGYSRDGERCRACLTASWDLTPGFVERWREDSTTLLSAADAVVYPSGFLRGAHARLFPAATPRREAVFAPAPPAGPPPERRIAGTSDVPRIAFVGAYRPHKGALVFEELVRTGLAADEPRPRWTILGSGDPVLLLRARRAGAAVAGHYRAGSLASRLIAERVDVALLLSIWPETYSLTLTECRQAGVPVVAFDHGAIAERVREAGGGDLVPLERGAAGIAEALARRLAGTRPVPEPRSEVEPGAERRRAAGERNALYRTLLSEPS